MWSRRRASRHPTCSADTNPPALHTVPTSSGTMAHMLLHPPADLAAPDRLPTRRQRRPWRTKFRDALRGVRLGVRGHSSFFVHFFCAALVIAAAAALQCGILEWALLVGCIGAVLTAELLNSALETLFHGLDADTK